MLFFQIRGAMNAVLQLLNSLPGDQKPVLVTHSSGNHAQAIALSAKIMGLKAFIAMPRNAPLVKKAAVRDYGATIIDCGVSGEVCHYSNLENNPKQMIMHVDWFNTVFLNSTDTQN